MKANSGIARDEFTQKIALSGGPFFRLKCFVFDFLFVLFVCCGFLLMLLCVCVFFGTVVLITCVPFLFVSFFGNNGREGEGRGGEERKEGKRASF